MNFLRITVKSFTERTEKGREGREKEGGERKKKLKVE